MLTARYPAARSTIVLGIVSRHGDRVGNRAGVARAAPGVVDRGVLIVVSRSEGPVP